MINLPRNLPSGELIPIHKGLSTEKKYRIECRNGEKYLLRIADAARFERKRAEAELAEQCVNLGLPVQQVYEYGLSNDGKEVYVLLSWIEGYCVADILLKIAPSECYDLGWQAGSILRKLHTIFLPASFPVIYDNTQAFEYIDNTLARYHDCGFQFTGDNLLIDYITHNRMLLSFRKPCYLHKDYRPDNMILSSSKLLWIIDWDSATFGDPWADFDIIFWAARISPEFACGQIHGYFRGKPPIDFFRVIALYEACNILNSISWIQQHGQGSIDEMVHFARLLLGWNQNFESVLPNWYEPKENRL